MKIVRSNSLLFLLSFLFSFVFASCGDDDKDTEAPGISIETPSEGEQFVRGVGEIEVSGELADNKGLDVCVISLTNELNSVVASTKSSSLDEGTNSGDDVVTSIDDPEPFEPDPVEYSLSGKSHTFSEESPFGSIPNDATTGPYTLTIEVTDVAGNTATENITINIGGI
jgi:hypothetical protein